MKDPLRKRHYVCDKDLEFISLKLSKVDNSEKPGWTDDTSIISVVPYLPHP